MPPMWLNNVNDRLGMDAKEQAFVIGLAMECYEKGLLTKKDTDGLELNWGNVQAVETLLHKIARRERVWRCIGRGGNEGCSEDRRRCPQVCGLHTRKATPPTSRTTGACGLYCLGWR